MSWRRTAAAWRGAMERVAAARDGLTRYGVVTTVADAYVNVQLDTGEVVSSVANAYNLASGARVQLRGTGGLAGTAWRVERPVRRAQGARTGDPNAIINTPSVARVATGFHQIAPDGTPYVYLRLAIWQIWEQYREGQRVKYEIQIQKSEGADLPVTLTIDEHGQMGAALAAPLAATSTLGENMEITPISTIPEIPTPEYFFFPYGAVDVLGEIIYYDTLGVNALNSLTRGQDTPEGVPTSDVAHDAGEFVLARTVMAETIGLAANTAYRYRVRAIIGEQASNYSDWATTTTAYDTTVPSWSATPTPTVSQVNGLTQVSWSAADVNTAHLLDYQVQTATDSGFTTDVVSYYTRSTQYTFPYRIGYQGYVRVRPRNTSYVAGAWSNTARIAGQRDVPAGRPLANRLTNGGFASNVTGWTAGGAGSTFSHDNTRGFIGLGSGKFELDRPSGGAGGSIGYIYQDVTGLAAGDVYHAIAYVCRSANFDETFDEVSLRAGGSLSPIAELSSLAVVDGGRWTLLEVDGIVPSGGTTVRVQLNAEFSTSTPAEQAYVWVDDLQFYVTGNKT